MEHKYFAAIYEDNMNDILRKADVIATYDAVREDREGRYSNTKIYHLGFDFHILKELRDARIDIEYTNDEGDGYYIRSGKLTDKNVKVDISSLIKGELAKSKAFSKALALRDKLADMNGERGIVDYKSDMPIPLIGFKSKIAYDKNIDLVLPFRERVVKTSDLRPPIIVYLHDEKSLGMNNIAQMPEAGYMLDAIKKSKRDHIAIVPHALVPFGRRSDDGIMDNAMSSLLDNILDYAVAILGGDKKKIYIVGTGIGAVGAIRLLTLKRKPYRGAILAFGIEETSDISILKDVNIEIVAADNDRTYPQEDFDDFVKEAEDNGIEILYTVFNNSEHKVYKSYYKEGGFVSRLLDDNVAESEIEVSSNYDYDSVKTDTDSEKCSVNENEIEKESADIDEQKESEESIDNSDMEMVDNISDGALNAIDDEIKNESIEKAVNEE